MISTPGSGLTSAATQPLPLRRVPSLFAGAAALLWAELLLTATASPPNTWAGVASSTAILAVAALVAAALIAWAARAPGPAGVGSLLAAGLFMLAFWAGGAIVLGATAYALNRQRHRARAWLGAGLAAVQALYLLVSIVIDFSPGLPA